MPTPVFLTVDVEIMWRHHAAGLDPATLFERSFEPAGVGLSYQLEMLRRHDLKGSFFVDPIPALIYGLDPFRRVIDAIQSAGQRVDLHLHPNWTNIASGDHQGSLSRFHLSDYDFNEQLSLIEKARDLLVAAGALPPVAFRGGNYAGNDDTLAALATLGFDYDTSHNGSVHPHPSGIGLPARQIAPIARGGVIEVPVTLIEERQGALRHFQICALSVDEMRAALDHAVDQDHAVVTIVSHGFELANRAGTRPNAVHVRRFDMLCALLDERRDVLPTQHFADRPELRLGQDDTPLRPNMTRLRWREAEQLWSNMVSERAL